MNSPFIQLKMPRIEVPFKDKFLIGDFLALNFTELDDDMVRDIGVGDPLSFKTRIIESNGPFPGVEVSEFEDEPEILIMLGTRESEIA
ncbi:hypothetical protein BST95_11615 [Halioglobus japonicus]|uniref:Uncharacterized protein n=2 Tax=Halioglobus japonicus TaxID=930805 RepID=A0AAP8SNN4_9GAMM|nr:hypothetical protein BST95_11615 [Halioglobus japonicus]PLW86820.1 hypothetical protein C0029_10610 [Halioglobus japonicus]